MKIGKWDIGKNGPDFNSLLPKMQKLVWEKYDIIWKETDCGICINKKGDGY